jgi:hypothetical protein
MDRIHIYKNQKFLIFVITLYKKTHNGKRTHKTGYYGAKRQSVEYALSCISQVMENRLRNK